MTLKFQPEFRYGQTEPARQIKVTV